MSEDYSQVQEQKGDNLAVGARGGLVAFVLQSSSAVFGFTNSIILARILSAGGIGEVFLALSVMNVCALIASFGMNGAMMRFIPFYIEKQEEAKLKGVIYFYLKFCFALSIIFVVFILLFSKFISINVFHSQGLLKLLPIAAVILPVYVINEVISGILRGYKDTFKALFPHMFVAPFLKIVVFLLLSLIDVSPIYAMVAVLIAEIISIVISILFLLNKIGRIKPLYERSEYKKVFNVASTMIFTAFSVFLYTHTSLWVVGMFNSTEDVGVYGVVSRLVVLISFSLGAFSTIIPPIISSVYTSNNHDELRRVVRESTRWILSMAMPIILVIIIEGKVILKYAYGETFSTGYSALLILSIGQLVNAGAGLTGWLLQMTGGHRTFMKITLFWGTMNVILSIVLVPYLGMVGAALSTAFCLAMVNIMAVFIIRNKLSVLTLAKGLKFDVVFAGIIAILYCVINYIDYYMGSHLLLAVALIAYISKSIIKGDLPLKIVLRKYKT